MTTEQPRQPIVPAPRRGDWHLEQDDAGVTALDASRAVAHVEVREEGSQVQLQFWLDEQLPRQLRTELTRAAFSHRALRPERRLVAAVPNRELDVLDELRAHLADSLTRAAGATLMLEGRVR
jgi:hypothetical protein